MAINRRRRMRTTATARLARTTRAALAAIAIATVVAVTLPAPVTATVPIASPATAAVTPSAPVKAAATIPMTKAAATIPTAPMAVDPSVGGLEIVKSVVTKVTGNQSGPIRAGDVLQYHVEVRNPAGSGNWTTGANGNPLTFTTDLTGLSDDATLIGVRHGSRGATYCGPTGWNTSYCAAADTSDPTHVSGSFALAAGGTYYINYRVQITNNYLAGDQHLENTLVIGGVPGEGLERIEQRVDFDDMVTVQHPDLEIANSVVTKVTGNQSGPIRAGDVLQYHVEVRNPAGSGDWTAASTWAEARPVTFSLDLTGIVDDAIVIGVRHGTRGANYCGPTGWSTSYCAAADITDPAEVSASFTLAAGSSYFINYRVKVTNDYLTGDHDLQSAMVITGEPGNDMPRVEVNASFTNPIDVQHPGIEVVNSVVTKITGNAAGPIRAGDVLQYHVEVRNPVGSGDWAAASDGVAERLVTFSTDLTGLGDDAVLLGVRHGNRGANYCGPTGWLTGYCESSDVSDPSSVTGTFAMAAGTSYYVNYRVKITNDYLAGDQQLENLITFTGDPGNEQPLVSVTAEFNDEVAVQHPDIEVVNSVVTKITGNAAGPIRAGDVLQYHVEVRNPAGSGDWTAGSDGINEKLVTFSTDLTGLGDDAVLLGVRHGNRGANYCGPTGWLTGYCEGADVSDPAHVTGSFAMAAGTTYYVNYRVKITNDYLAGDQQLENLITFTGDPGNEQPLVSVTAEFHDEVAVQHPDIEVVNSVVTKITGNASGPIRAGDVLQYHVEVRNPVGSGDWAAGSDGINEKLVTFSTDLTGLGDDAVLLGVRHGNRGANYCGPTGWLTGYCESSDVSDPSSVTGTFAMAAGTSYYVNYRVKITNDYIAGDQQLDNLITFTGDPGNEQPLVSVTAEFNDEVAVQHPDIQVATPVVTKITGDATQPIRAGDVLQYHVRVTNTGDGDWIVGSDGIDEKLVTFSTDLSGLLDDAVLIGVRHGTSTYYCGPTGWDQSYCAALPVDDDGHTTTTFALAAGASRYINYRIEVSDSYTGDHTLFNEAIATGDPGNSLSPITVSATASDPLDVQYPDLSIVADLANVTRPTAETPRAGDVLEYTVKVTNPGKINWSAGTPGMPRNLVTFTGDLTGVLDDAVWHDGSPDGCYVSNCSRFDAPADGLISTSFALAQGATKTMRFRLVVSDSFTGDQSLTAIMHASGDSHGPEAVIDVATPVMTASLVQYPDVTLDYAWTKSPRAGTVVRAGDLVTYTVTIKNTGDGDWNVPSTWAAGNPLTLTADLSDILDDSVLIGSVAGGATITDGVLSWSGALAAGRTKIVTFTVQVGNSATGTGTDLLMTGEACVSGDSRNPAREDSTITVCESAEFTVGERWRLTNTAYQQDGTAMRDYWGVHPGDLVTYRVDATSVGGWPLQNMVLTDDISDALEVSAIEGDIVLEVDGVATQTLTVADGVITTDAFDLPANATATIVYSVRVPEDMRSGTLRTAATGVATGADGSVVVPAACGTATRPCVTEQWIFSRTPTVTKSASTASGAAQPAPGETVTYTVRVTNPGPGVWSAQSPLSIVDDLARVLDDADLTAAHYVTSTDAAERPADVTDGELSWQGALGAGEWIEFSYDVVINEAADAGDRVLLNQACAGAPGRESRCDTVVLTIPLISQEVDTPVWGPAENGCVTPPWIDLPVTPGVIYTMSGEVTPGGSVTVTATPMPGYTLVVPVGWTASGNTASLTVHFAECVAQQYAAPVVELSLGACSVDGTMVPPTLETVVTPGITYTVEGEVIAGGTVVITATAVDGYLLTRGSSLQNWVLSPDRLTATLTVTFPVPECGDDEPPTPALTDPPLPWWAGPTCAAPDRTPELRVPEVDGLTYVVTGTVALGNTVTVTVTADSGQAFRGTQLGWQFSADRKTATRAITFAPAGDCEVDSNAGTHGGAAEATAEANGAAAGGGTDDGANTAANGSGESGPSGEPIDIVIAPFPSIAEPVCVAGVAVMPDLRVIMVPGVWYDITGDNAPGGTLVLTAYTLPGYILENTAAWMTGQWDVAADRKSATRTVVFPTLEELCAVPGDAGADPVDEGVDPVDEGADPVDEGADPVDEGVDPVDEGVGVDPVDAGAGVDPVDAGVGADPVDPADGADGRADASDVSVGASSTPALPATGSPAGGAMQLGILLVLAGLLTVTMAAAARRAADR